MVAVVVVAVCEEWDGGSSISGQAAYVTNSAVDQVYNKTYENEAYGAWFRLLDS